MAEEKVEAPVIAGGPVVTEGGSKKQSLILLILAIINMAVIGSVGFMIWQGKKKEEKEPKLQHVISGEKDTQSKEAAESKIFTAKVVPLETFIVNLAGSKGRRVAKVNIELGLEGDGITTEIEQRKAQIRDIIIILLSGQTYDQVATREGKDQLKEQIKDTVNAFLTKGKIKEVYFTEFIYN